MTNYPPEAFAEQHYTEVRLGPGHTAPNGDIKREPTRPPRAAFPPGTQTAPEAQPQRLLPDSFVKKGLSIAGDMSIFGVPLAILERDELLAAAAHGWAAYHRTFQGPAPATGVP